MHHLVTEMCTLVHISVTKWCIMGYLSGALWDLWEGSNTFCGGTGPWGSHNMYFQWPQANFGQSLQVNKITNSHSVGSIDLSVKTSRTRDRDSPTVWPQCAFFFILLQFYVPFYVKKKKIDNFMCLLEFECAKRLKAHSRAIPEGTRWTFIKTLPYQLTKFHHPYQEKKKSLASVFRDHFVYMPSQWELHCNTVSHWLGP